MSDVLVKLINDLPEEKRAVLARLLQPTAEPVAVIGMACRFPGGANTPDALWSILENGIDAIGEVPPNRWPVDAFYSPDIADPGKTYTRWGGFIDQIDQFDAAFFGISPREAIHLDPQQRLLLEVSWEALENAGQVLDNLWGSQTGVFIGSCGSDYLLRYIKDVRRLDTYAATGNAQSIVAGRLSYTFNFNGPSVTVDTACSSSLVSVHMASQSLRGRECDLALAGGVNLILSPEGTISFSKARMLAPDGRCKTFDARADGYVRSEGCGIVILKRLSDAQRDGDTILAVLRGSAINQDGHSSGLTAPNGSAQQAVIRQAMQRAGVTPEQIGYIEAHGTGTALGDPIETDALQAVFGKNPLTVGAVKANIGHTEAAAGIAGLIKVILALKNRAIPPQVHFERLNPNIGSLSFTIPQTLQTWANSPRLAGISAFGFSGTNAHVIVSEPPVPAVSSDPALPESSAFVLPLSARSSESLRQLAEDYASFLTSTQQRLYDICYTASLRRTQHTYRLIVIGESAQQLAEKLHGYLDSDLPFVGHGKPTRKIVFVFSGQGSHWVGMARHELQRFPIFRQAIEACDAAMRPYLSWSLLTALETGMDAKAMEQADVIQPLLFAIGVAQAAVWRAFGVIPDAVVGHSLGEITAAYIAEILTLEQAAQLICLRSQLAQRVAGQGGMLSVEMSLEEANSLVASYGEGISVAGSNSPHAQVLAGSPTALDSLATHLKAEGIFYRPVKVEVAYHSVQMEPLKDELFQQLRTLTPSNGTVAFYSTVEGCQVEGSKLDAAYWARNLREPVRFTAATQQLAADGFELFIELSPNPVLSSALEQTSQTANISFTILSSMRKNQPNVLLDSLARLYSLGVKLDWHAAFPVAGRVVQLPTYAWQRERFWSDFSDVPTAYPEHARREGHVIIGCSIPFAAQANYLWNSVISSSQFDYLDDHQVQGITIVPGTFYLEMLSAAAKDLLGESAYQLENIKFHKALALPKSTVRPVQITCTIEETGLYHFQIFSQESGWTLHASAQLRLGDSQPLTFSLSDLRKSCTTFITADEHYQIFAEHGMTFGPTFHGVTGLWQGGAQMLGQMAWPPDLLDSAEDYQAHPAMFDACLQVLPLALLKAAEQSGQPVGKRDVYMPVAIDRLIMRHPLRGELSVLVQWQADLTDMLGSVFILNDRGEVLIEVLGLRLQRVDQHSESRSPQNNSIESKAYHLAWREISRSAEIPQSDAHWLILSDRGGIGVALAQQLESDGQPCFLVEAEQVADQLTTLTENSNRVSPDSREALSTLCKTLFADTRCAGVVHLWSLDSQGRDLESLDLESLHLAQKSGSNSVLALLQTLAQLGWRESPRLWLVTCATQTLTDDDPTNPIHAPIWGLGRVIAYEHPELHCTRIDLESDLSASRAQVISQLRAELYSADSEDQVIFRQGKHFAARLINFEGQFPAPMQLSADGTYLITGGLGGLGLAIARWIAEHGAQHLVLMGRRQPTSEADAMIQELTARGIEVNTFAGDISSAEAVAKVLESIDHHMPPLRGIIHAAAAIDDGILLHLNPERMQTAMAAKVDGAWHLHQQTQSLDLEFFVMFSSIASLLGSPGQGNYTAANAFMDALAHYRRAQGLPALTINWGPWAEIGLASNRSRSFNGRGATSLDPTTALEIFGRLLSTDLSQIAIMNFDKRQWEQFFPMLAASPFWSILTESKGIRKAPLLDKLRAEPEHARRKMLLERHILEQVGQVLRLPASRIDIESSLTSLGLDSLMALELRNGLETSLALTLPATLIWGYPTIASLGEYLLEQVDLTVHDPGKPARMPAHNTDDSELETDFDSLLTDIESLSDDEVRQRFVDSH